MSSAPKEQQAPLMLGVSGLRGIVGQTLTAPVAAQYAAAVGQWFVGQTPGKMPHLVVGRDSRLSGKMLELAALAGLLASGCRVTSLGIASTPAVAVMVGELAAEGGLVITASHNPAPWNGIKVLRREGVAPPPAQAQQIIDLFRGGALAYAAVEALGTLGHNAQAGQIHCDQVLEHVPADTVRGRGLKVVLDSVHGAGGPEALLLLAALGVSVIHLYGEPTGRFPHPPEPLKENLEELAARVAQEKADVGFAQDPDADRLVVIDEQGRYIGEEYTMALACLHVLSRQSQPAGAVLASNLSSSRMIDDIAEKYGAKVLRTPVGEASVAQALRENGGLIGGEGNGGVIYPKVVAVRDSLVGMALILEMLALRDQALSEIVASLPAYAMIKKKLPLAADLLPELPQRLRRALGDEAQLDLQDGVRADLPGRKWVHVRASNTEPLIRIIAEAPDAAVAQELVAKVERALQ